MMAQSASGRPRRGCSVGLEAEWLGVLQAHPDLAGASAAAKRLTADLTVEQAGAGSTR